MECLFCEIVAGRHRASIVLEDDWMIAFMDLFPITRGHLLVVPKPHVTSLEDCPAAVAVAIARAAQRLNRALRSAVDCEAVLNQMMNGAAAGQELSHIQLHVIPRWTGDGWVPTYPPGYRAQPECRVELDEIADRVRRNL